MRNRLNIPKATETSSDTHTFKKPSKIIKSLVLVMAVISLSAFTANEEDYLIIKEQGSFAVGGSVITNPGTDGWRVRMEMARLWRDAVNRHGGDVTVLHLPEIGIKGNTHFPFSDLNNIEIADLMSDWLKEKGVD